MRNYYQLSRIPGGPVKVKEIIIRGAYPLMAHGNFIHPAKYSRVYRFQVPVE
jgi:hypothetical protein